MSIFERVVPFITAIAALATIIVTVWFHYADGRAQAHEKLLEHRRAALMLALQVIDHVYANEPLNSGKPYYAHRWDLQLAWEADNQIRIYCGDPQTRQLFIKALGIYDPTTGKPPGVDITALDKFRKQVAHKLDLPEPISDPNRIWISGLAGAAPRNSGQTE